MSAVASELSLPVWAKLSPNTDRLVSIAGRVRDAGAAAVTLINTVLGMALDPDTGRPALGNGGGGLSGRAIHPVATATFADPAAPFRVASDLAAWIGASGASSVASIVGRAHA